jgi:hypothetical protein
MTFIADRPHNGGIGFPAEGLNIGGQVGGGDKGVAPKTHRRRAGVIGPAQKRDPQSGGVGDGRGDADAHPLRLKHPALLDVDLEERTHIVRSDARGRDGFRVEALTGQEVHQAAPVRVPEIQELLGPQNPGHDAASDGRQPEPAGLLGDEDHRLHRAIRGLRVLAQDADDLQGRRHADASVEFSARRNRVDVGAHPEGGKRRVFPLHPAEEVADPVYPNRETRRLHQVQGELAGRDLLRGERKPLDAAAGHRPDAGEPHQVRPDALGLNPGFLRHLPPSQPSAAPSRMVRNPRGGVKDRKSQPTPEANPAAANGLAFRRADCPGWGVLLRSPPNNQRVKGNARPGRRHGR